MRVVRTFRKNSAEELASPTFCRRRLIPVELTQIRLVIRNMTGGIVGPIKKRLPIVVA